MPLDRRSFLRKFAATLALGLPSPSATLATARTQRRRALLIGVSEYPSLQPRYQLRGPKNDVRAWLTHLQKSRVPFAPQDISVLADDVTFPGGLEPTRANILAGLDAAIALARPGDFQLVYFAGHGSQAPQPPNADHVEQDGMDEIFLPRDVGRWDGKRGLVTNSIIDDEIGDRLDAVRAAGSNVFAVFDCCHAATMARADAGVRWRAVPTLELGIQGAGATLVGSRQIQGQRRAPLTNIKPSGTLTAFYASGGFQAAPEELLPRRAASSTQAAWRGVFTFHLIAALEQADLASTPSLRDASLEILRRYAAEQRIAPAPRFEFP